jgi:ribosomal protein S18 acetylase RimI-like enzyme
MRMHSPRLRPASPGDAASLAAVESRAWRRAYAGIVHGAVLRKLEPARRAPWWAARIARREPVWVAEDPRGVVAGYVSFGPARHPDLEPGFAGEVFELYVDPDHQRRGVGAALLRGASARLREAGLLWLVLEVLRDNHDARAFYAAAGLQTEGRTRLRSAGQLLGGRRYSVPNSAVVVVRYEGPLGTGPIIVSPVHR